MLVYIFTRANQ